MGGCCMCLCWGCLQGAVGADGTGTEEFGVAWADWLCGRYRDFWSVTEIPFFFDIMVASSVALTNQQ